MEKSEFDIGAHVRMWRKERGLLQKELAARAGVNATQLWALEKGRFSPSMRSIERIANALGITLQELMSPPGTSTSLEGDEMSRTAGRLVMPDIDYVPTIKPQGTAGGKNDAWMRRMAAMVDTEREIEMRSGALAQTNLPLHSQVSTSEAGAEQLAYALRAHLDVGSAILHDTIPLFESHGVRVLDTKLPDDSESLAFYSPRDNNFSVIISSKFKDKPWRRDFLFLTEIGRAFIFTRRGQMPYGETARSRRFAHHFAAVFLQPESSVRNAVYSLHVKPDEWTYELLLRMKVRFGVSADLFNIRLKELSLITRRKHKEFDMDIKRHYNGTGYAEPMPKDMAPGRIRDLTAAGRCGA